MGKNSLPVAQMGIIILPTSTQYISIIDAVCIDLVTVCTWRTAPYLSGRQHKLVYLAEPYWTWMRSRQKQRSTKHGGRLTAVIEEDLAHQGLRMSTTKIKIRSERVAMVWYLQVYFPILRAETTYVSLLPEIVLGHESSIPLSLLRG
jgi:hypothetical protein